MTRAGAIARPNFKNKQDAKRNHIVNGREMPTRTKRKDKQNFNRLSISNLQHLQQKIERINRVEL